MKRSAPRLAEHALSSLLAVRPLERLYCGRPRKEEAREVLVRQLLPGLDDAERDATRPLFEEHFARLATLTDPGCLPLRERANPADSSSPLYLVTDAPTGITLGELARAAGSLPTGLAARVVTDVIDRLIHARAAGVLHLAVQRGSVLVDAEGRVTLVDLGVAPFLLERLSGVLGVGPSASGGARPAWVGAAWDSLFADPAAVAPELVAGEALTPAADVYGVGALLYFLLTAAMPYTGSSVVIYNAILSGRGALDPRAHVEAIEPAVAELVSACLARDPAARPPDLEAVRAVLAPRAEPVSAFLTAYGPVLRSRPYVDRFQPLLRLVGGGGGAPGAYELAAEADVVVPLFQGSAEPLSEGELLARMSPEQRRIWFSGATDGRSEGGPGTATRRGITLGVVIAVVLLAAFAPGVLQDLGSESSSSAADSRREPAPLPELQAVPDLRGSEDWERSERRNLELYLDTPPR